MAKINTIISFNDIQIPTIVYIEKRNGWRASIKKDKAIVRLPNQSTKDLQKVYYKKAKDWIKQTLKEKPQLIVQFTPKKYDNRIINIMGEAFTIQVTDEDRLNGVIKLLEGKVRIQLPFVQSEISKSQMIKKLISKLFSNLYKEEIENEVKTINNKYYNKEIKAVRIKYNKSNWGSCSSKNNINLSSRLLLVPREVREYVIIHELSHLIEMNHSSAFWQIVENACPNYKVFEKWLKINGSEIDF